MSTQDNNSLEAVINAGKMKAGNPVLNSSGAVAATQVSQLTTDSSGNLQVTTHLPIVGETTTSKLFEFTGTATADVLTQTLVAGATVTTATKAGFIRVGITDAGGVMTNGSYYLEVFTIV